MFNRKERNKQYYIKNKDRLLRRAKKRYKNNPEKIKESVKRWKKNNPEKVEKINKRWRENNQDKIRKWVKNWIKNNTKKWKKYAKKYQKDNAYKINEYAKKYYKNNIKEKRKYNREWKNNKLKWDLKFALNSRIKNAIRYSLHGNKAGRHWEDLVGYTLKDLMKRLKKTMPGGYTWQDYLDGKLHIDHIIPISAHNFTKPEHTDFKRCWALSNLQLLPAKENLSKHNKLLKPIQLSLKI